MTGSEAEKTFLLGVGCQKGGTTWLFDYLSRSPFAKMPPMKELHIFDVLDLETGRRRLTQTMRKSKRVRPDMRSYEPTKLKKAMIKDVEVYFNYFMDLLDEEKTLLTADITPSYAALSPDRYRFIKDRFEEGGVTVKVIFLMRDPVERAWSSVRMRLRNKTQRKPDSRMLARHDEESLLLKVYNNESQLERTRYHTTIENLETVFDHHNIYYGFYERLFNKESTAAICSFLGIPYIDPDFDQRLNESPKSGSISPDVSVAVAESYREVYRYVEDRFGVDFIDSIWPNTALVPR